MASENTTPPEGATLIWERTVDEAKIARRKKRFLIWYVLPSVAAIVVGGIFGGLGAAAGIAILLGLFGLLVGGWVFFLNFNQRSLRYLWTIDGQLHQFRKKGIPYDLVNEFCVGESSLAVTDLDIGADAVVATFRAEGVLLETMTWPSMPRDQIPALASALESLMPGKQISPKEMTGLLHS